MCVTARRRPSTKDPHTKDTIVGRSTNWPNILMGACKTYIIHMQFVRIQNEYIQRKKNKKQKTQRNRSIYIFGVFAMRWPAPNEDNVNLMVLARNRIRLNDWYLGCIFYGACTYYIVSAYRHISLQSTLDARRRSSEYRVRLGRVLNNYCDHEMYAQRCTYQRCEAKYPLRTPLA